MGRLVHSFLVMLAAATDKALARQVQYLEAENAILRSKLPKRLPVTPAERRRLVKLGKAVGPAIKDLIGIVSPRTFARWASGEGIRIKAARTAQSEQPAKSGRPRTPDDLRGLILRLARVNDWGSTRILGELKKLGVGKICRSTVVNILFQAGLDPGPKRGEGTLDEFVKRHAKTLWATAFFSKKVWTVAGLVDVFVLFFLHVGSRKVFVAGLTTHPDRAWVVQQARNLIMASGEQADKQEYLLRDYDTKLVPDFDALMESEEITVKKVGPLAPNLNARAECWIQRVKRKCLDLFIVFGEDHLRYLVSEYPTYHNRFRPHQALGNRPLSGEPPPEWNGPVPAVVCEERLGGLLRHYTQQAA